jgi:hypothetical protein
MTTTLHVDHGTLNVAATGGATVGGSGTSTVTLTGSLAQIDAALSATNGVIYHGASSFSGVDHLVMTSNDGGSFAAGGPQSATSTTLISVNAAQHAPVAQAGSASGNEDTVISGTLVATEAGSASLTYSGVAQPAHGSLTVHANGAFSYAPNADYNGSDSFTSRRTTARPTPTSRPST